MSLRTLSSTAPLFTPKNSVSFGLATSTSGESSPTMLASGIRSNDDFNALLKGDIGPEHPEYKGLQRGDSSARPRPRSPGRQSAPQEAVDGARPSPCGGHHHPEVIKTVSTATLPEPTWTASIRT